ncbi:MAG: hypothetical protein AB8G11_04445 [Saprospiraceae bacterium]
MVDLKEFEFIELTWFAKDNWNRNFKLVFDDELIATIKFPSIWSKKATCITASGTWTIKLSGVFNPELTVRRKDVKRNIIEAPMQYTKPKEPIRFPSGNTYEFKKESNWKSHYSWFYDDEPVFNFKSLVTLDKRRLSVSFTKANLPEDDLSLMLLIGSYLIITIQQNGGM